MTDLAEQCGAIATKYVNIALYQYSGFVFNHAYYFNIESLYFAEAMRPKVEYNLAVAQREIANFDPFSPVEDIFTAGAYIAAHSEKYTISDAYKVLNEAFTWPSKNYYYVKAKFTQTDPEFMISLP